jgi:hypothetical protein
MMKFSIRHRLRAAGIVVAAAAAAMPLGPAHAEPPGPDVPPTIAVEDGHKVFLVGHAVGVQIYACNATASGFTWSFVAPRADLFGDNGKLVASHFDGPTWRAQDGSTVRAARRGDPLTVDPTAIPWLLLSTVSTTAGQDGDRLTHTTFIQRTATTGGQPPAPGKCNADTARTTVEVPYTADYHFWKSTGR